MDTVIYWSGMKFTLSKPTSTLIRWEKRGYYDLTIIPEEGAYPYAEEISYSVIIEKDINEIDIDDILGVIYDKYRKQTRLSSNKVDQIKRAGRSIEFLVPYCRKRKIEKLLE
jgi:hypothetical protein